ncbi:MAG: hypothetical protein ACYTBX_00845 [Planctomycetota bacterium]
MAAKQANCYLLKHISKKVENRSLTNKDAMVCTLSVRTDVDVYPTLAKAYVVEGNDAGQEGVV